MPSVGFFGAALGGLGGSAVGSAVVTLYLADQQYNSQLAKAKGQTEAATLSMGQKAKALGPAFLVAGAAAAVGIGVQAVKAFNESEAAIAQTNAVLKSTKGIAGVTAAEVTKLASTYQKLTTFSDEEVRSAENLLLTFTNISSNIFPETTKAVLDMSQALGQDLKSSSIQLGKALNDPILGLTSLGRVGVKFTQDTRDQIKALVEQGNILGAQKIILHELATEFGGSATAAAKTFAGQMKVLGNQLNDVLEELGRFIVQVARALLPVMKAVVPVLKLAAEHTTELVIAFGVFATVRWVIPFLETMTIKTLAFASASLTAQVAATEMFAAIAAAAGPIGIALVALGAFVVVMEKVPTRMEDAVSRLEALGFTAEEAADRLKPLTAEFEAQGIGSGIAKRRIEDYLVQAERGAEEAEGWAAQQQAYAHSLEVVAEKSHHAGRATRRFAGLSKDALADFKDSASTSLNFVEASFTDLISASHKSATGILRNMRRALRSQQEFAENSTHFLGEVREDFGPRMETAAQQMVQILAESGRDGADEMAALRGASDRQIRSMLDIFAKGRQGASHTADVIGSIKTKLDGIPNSKTIDVYVNVHTTGSGTTASDQNIADALARELAHGG